MKEICTTDEINNVLAQRDPALGTLIARAGHVRIALRSDYFSALLSAIVEQQLSGRVAEVIWDRLKALLGGKVLPENLLATPDADLRAIGMSNAKARYAKALSEAVGGGTLRLDGLEALSDEEIMRQLTAVKGIGSWTAEMF